MKKEIKDKIIEGMEKTGYLLEYNISNILISNDWKIINSRYYVDENKEREIDILAYKVIKIKDILYYTSLIISCKKDKKNKFCMFTRKKIENDPNVEYYPDLSCTNSNLLKKMCLKNSEEINNMLRCSIIHGVDRHIFAFQLISDTGKVQNDKPIYDSIISVIKAYEYEKKSLLETRTNQCFYNFNLLSICDGDLVELFLKTKEDIDVREIEEIKYINRHIISNREEFYRVHFIKADKFEKYLEEYNNLHKYNINYYPSLLERYYDDVLEGKADFAWLKDEFISKIKEDFYYSLEIEVQDITLFYYKDVLSVSIYDEKGNSIKNLNKQGELFIKDALEEVYRYKGKFEIDFFPF